MNEILNQQHRARFSAQGSRAEDGTIEILAITAGTGNGWKFGAEVLQTSLGLWQGVESYIDHTWQQRSVRDLAGVCANPRWDDETRGIQLTLTPLGPSADVLISL